MLDCWALLSVRSRIKLLGLPTTFRSAGQRFSNSTNQAFNRSLSKDVFWATHVNRKWGLLPIYICLDSNKFVLLSFFSLIKRIYPRVWTKPLPSDAKSPLPVDVRRPKTLLLKLPTSTRSDAFSFLLYIDTTKLVSLSIFKNDLPKTLAKLLSINAKSPFPVDVGRSKMPPLKFPPACVQLKPNGHRCKSVKVQLLNREK